MDTQALITEVTRLHANLCAALSDPTRILILYILSEQPSSVNALTERLELAQPKVSRHLKVLRERGLVRARRDGQFMIYSLADERVIEALDLLRVVLAEKLNRQSILADQAAEKLSVN
jgi:DNA-binding transcriptional ArsR family regulator